MSNQEATIDKNDARRENFTSKDDTNAAHIAAGVYGDKGAWQQLGKNDFKMPEGFEKNAPTIDFGPKDSNVATKTGSDKEINSNVVPDGANKAIKEAGKDLNNNNDANNGNPDKAPADKNNIDKNNIDKNVKDMNTPDISNKGVSEILKNMNGGDKNQPLLDDKGSESRSERGAFDEGSKKQIEDQTKRELNPVAKSMYDKEEKSLQDYDSQVRRWGMGTGGGPMPERPSTPVHDAVKERAAAREKEIEKQAKDEYGPIGKSELKRQMRDHDEKTDKFYKSINPAGTGDWRKAPEPPALVKEYYDKVKRIIASKN